MPDTAYDITQPYLGLIQKYRPNLKDDEADINAQRKIAKGNAVAEAFRLLIDAVGGTKGANIQQRDVSNPVMKAVDTYYKLKDASKQEQSKWDMAELGAGMDALKTKSNQEYQSAEQEKQRAFTEKQTAGSQAFQAEQGALSRDQQAAALKENAAQFKSKLGLEQQQQDAAIAAKKVDQEIEREKIQADRERVQAMYPYNKLTGMAIADEETDSIIRIPDAAIEQTLAFMEADPKVQDQIGFIKAKFNNLGTTQEVKYLIAQNFAMLSPETKQRIRNLAQNSAQRTANPATPQQQPTIQTNKNSTMVQATQPSVPQGNQPLAPDQLSAIQKIIGASNYTAEVKRSAVYRYLIEQGYDAGSAKAAAESVYQSIINK